MTTKTDSERRRTTMVPVTTMEEVPILSSDERASLIASLEEAEFRIQGGEYVEYKHSTSEEKLVEVRDAARNNRAI